MSRTKSSKARFGQASNPKVLLPPVTGIAVDSDRQRIWIARNRVLTTAYWADGAYKAYDEVSAEKISAIINEEVFESLDGPIVRLTALDTPVPFSPPQEEFFLPKVSDVVREARKLLAY